MQLFYSLNITGSEAIVLDAEESRHCAKVLRKRPGDKIEVVDGKGNLYLCRLLHVDVKVCKAEVISVKKNYGKRNFNLSIAMAPTKNVSRFEWFLEKATEIGIDEVVPLLTGRCERTHVNLERLNKILVSAMKQSGKAFLPRLQEPVDYVKFMKSLAPGNSCLRFIATCDRENSIHLKDAYSKGSDALVLIGPEGDFTDEEVELAVKYNFQPISLGPARLRVETAGIVAGHTVNLLNE